MGRIVKVGGGGGAHLVAAYIISQRPGGMLGSLRDMGGALTENDKGLIVLDGLEFDEVTAEVLVGSRRRPVGLIGPNSETGAIDVSETIEYGLNGHPTFDSVRSQSDLIIKDFYKRLSCFALVVFLPFMFLKLNAVVCSSITCVIYAHFILTLMMTVKRAHTLFQMEYDGHS